MVKVLVVVCKSGASFFNVSTVSRACTVRRSVTLMSTLQSKVRRLAAGGTRIKSLFTVPNFLKHFVDFWEKTLWNDSVILQSVRVAFFGSRCIWLCCSHFSSFVTRLLTMSVRDMYKNKLNFLNGKYFAYLTYRRNTTWSSNEMRRDRRTPITCACAVYDDHWQPLFLCLVDFEKANSTVSHKKFSGVSALFQIPWRKVRYWSDVCRGSKNEAGSRKRQVWQPHHTVEEQNAVQWVKSQAHSSVNLADRDIRSGSLDLEQVDRKHRGFWNAVLPKSTPDPLYRARI